MRQSVIAVFALLVMCVPAASAVRSLDEGYVACSTTDKCITFDLVTYAIGDTIELLPGADYPYDATIRPDGSEVFRTDLDGDYMAEFVERNRDKPFFLYFSPNAVHSPSGDTPARYQNRSTATGKRKALAGAIIAVDDAVGKLRAVLKKHNLENDTILFLTGDNGPNLGEGGSAEPYRGGKGAGTQLEGWVHTPAVIAWPGNLPAGRTYDGLMGTMDFYATAAAVAGKPLPERCEGVNLLPYLRGEKTGDAHETLYWHNVDPDDAKRRRLRAMRWKQWRLVEYLDGWKLFDLNADPKETRDLAAAHPDVAAAMRKRYDAWAAALPPPDTSWKKDGRGGRMPQGWGWATDAGKETWKRQTGAEDDD